MACAVPLIRHAQLEAELADVASALAGTEVTVRCETVGEAWVQAHPERGYVRLSTFAPFLSFDEPSVDVLSALSGG